MTQGETSEVSAPGGSGALDGSDANGGGIPALALDCPICGAKGFDPCNLAEHVATLLGFAAQATREKRIEVMKRAEEVKP